MNIIDLPITIIDNIIGNINDTETYANIRLTCKSFYYLMDSVKRFYSNKSINELFFMRNNSINGYYMKWYNNGNMEKMYFYINNEKHGNCKIYYDNSVIKKDTKYLKNQPKIFKEDKIISKI